MNTSTPRAPGLTFEAVRPPAEPSSLRSDIAGFIGRTLRGPIGTPVRVEGWKEYLQVFGGLDRSADTPYAIRGYFENGGQVAWVIRAAGHAHQTVFAIWEAAELWGMPWNRLAIAASSPGDWAKNGKVELRWRRDGVDGLPEIDLSIRIGDEAEMLVGLPAWSLIETVASSSRLIRLVPLDEPRLRPSRQEAPAGRRRDRASLRVVGPEILQEPPTKESYLAAADLLGDVPEVAIVALPDLHRDLPDAGTPATRQDAAEVVRLLLAQAEALRDRIVLVDFPPVTPRWQAEQLTAWLDATLGRGGDGERPWRAGAAYHSYVRVPDPLGGVARPLRTLPPSGHVAGMISQLDRSRGAHHTPANVPLLGVVDLEEEYSKDEHGFLNDRGVNLIRCAPGVGFAAMGGRTIDPTGRFRYLAHRRLVHRLIRAARRVAEPLVFETNGPTLWLALVRGITSVLLEGWRSGALKGAVPEQAFLVKCDTETNPPEEIELGRCVCEIAVAPEIPMEFIVLRVALSRDGSLEVLS